MEKPTTVDQYLAQFPEEIARRLKAIRKLIFDLYPQVEEKIGYGMPSYKLNKRQFLYYAAFKNHIGFYGYPKVYLRYEHELKGYKQGRGSVQFQHKEEFPVELIEKMIVFRAEEMFLKYTN